MIMDNIKNTMLGHLACDIELVIITPLASTFRRLKETLEIEMIYDRAFFENCIFKIDKDNKKGMIILSPQGIASKDIIELFENTKILFFGLAGSLNSELEIGTFVEIETAINKEETTKLITTGEEKTVKCGYSPCLLGAIAKKYCDLSRKLDCDVVDMETVYCSKTAIERNNSFTSLLLISDIPNVINFWEILDQTKIKFKESRETAIDKIINYIDILVEKE